MQATVPSDDSGARRNVLRSAVMATLALTIVAIVMGGSQGGPGYFIGLGDQSTALEFARDVLGRDVPTPLADGHDGESFWLLARDPSLSGGRALAQYLDRPLYRAQRIGYPALASPWRFAGEQSLLWGLVITNLAAVAIGTWLTGSTVARQGGPSLAGYAFAANPLVWLALLFDFSDAVALAALVGVIWAIRRGRPGVAGAIAIMAALAKESSCLGIAAIALLSRGLSWRQRVAVALPAAVSVITWRLYVMAQPGFGSDAQVQEFALVPFSGYAEAWRLGWSPNGQWLDAVIAFALVPIAAALVWAWWRHRDSVELCAALPFAVFVPFLSGQVLDIPINSVRAIGPALTLGAAGLLVRWRGTPPSALRGPNERPRIG